MRKRTGLHEGQPQDTFGHVGQACKTQPDRQRPGDNVKRPMRIGTDARFEHLDIAPGIVQVALREWRGSCREPGHDACSTALLFVDHETASKQRWRLERTVSREHSRSIAGVWQHLTCGDGAVGHWHRHSQTIAQRALAPAGKPAGMRRQVCTALIHEGLLRRNRAAIANRDDVLTVVRQRDS